MPLPEECEVALRAIRRRTTRRILAWWAVAPAVLGLALAVCALVPHSLVPRWTEPVLIFAVCIAGVSFIPAILQTSDGMARIRGPARRALRAGVIHRYRLDPQLQQEMAAAKALGRRVPQFPLTIDIYPTVGRIARVDDVVMRAWRASSPPISPATLADAPGRLTTMTGSSRSLNPDEIRELESWVRRLGQPHWLVLAVLAAIAIAATYGLARVSFKPQLLVPWALVTVWMMGVLRGVRIKRMNVRVQAKLRRDIVEGRVRILDRAGLSAWFTANAPGAHSLAESADLLENSNRLWTTDGVPSPWRMLGADR